jgi:integrase/recombinase XerD
VGIYLRNLRHIFNREKIDESIYPFGVNKYEIPTGKNIKKALSLDDVIKIANYEPKNDSEAFARDMWIFSFQANGMNMKDVFSLKRGNISDNMIIYVREKTIRTKREGSKIQVSLKPESREIIQRWGNVIQLGEKEPYVFPFLRKDMTHQQIKATVKQLIKNINKWMKKITAELGIEANVTTYYARHSFATILKRSGVSTEFISDSLGHGNT